MKVKRFFAPDMRQAIRMVREEQGPDAVILSNRRVDGGVEIVAATDYSEELFTQFQSDSKPQAPVQTERGAAGVNKYQQYSDAADGESDDLPPPVRAPRAADAPAVSAAAYDHGATVPAQDPLLAQVRDELKTLRAYLETQMAEVAWNNLSKRSPLQAEIVKRGVQFGLSHALARELAHFAQHAVDIAVAWTACLARLAAKIPVAADDMIAQGGIIAMVGPPASAKPPRWRCSRRVMLCVTALAASPSSPPTTTASGRMSSFALMDVCSTSLCAVPLMPKSCRATSATSPKRNWCSSTPRASVSATYASPSSSRCCAIRNSRSRSIWFWPPMRRPAASKRPSMPSRVSRSTAASSPKWTRPACWAVC